MQYILYGTPPKGLWPAGWDLETDLNFFLYSGDVNL